MVSSVVRPLHTCCGFPQKARTSMVLCIIAGSTAVAGLGWTHSSSTFLSSVASSLCKCRILRTAWAGLLSMSFAAKRPSASEGKEATPQRTLPGQDDFDTGDALNLSRLPEISGARPPSLWHPPLDLAHRFTPLRKTDFAGFCPLLTSHSPSDRDSDRNFPRAGPAGCTARLGAAGAPAAADVGLRANSRVTCQLPGQVSVAAAQAVASPDSDLTFRSLTQAE